VVGAGGADPDGHGPATLVESCDGPRALEGRAARDDIRAVGRRPHRLPGARGGTRPGADPWGLRARGPPVGRPGDRAVPAHPGLVLAADPVRPTWHRRLRPAPRGPAAALGGVRRRG